MVTPAEAVDQRGLRKDWIAREMAISPSYLSLLLSGKRRWSETLIQRFTRVVGVREDAVAFPQEEEA